MRVRLGPAFVLAAIILSPLAGRAADNIKIGFPMPLSGPAAVYGVPVTKGAELAVADINAKGGVLGRISAGAADAPAIGGEPARERPRAVAEPEAQHMRHRPEPYRILTDG